MRCWRSSTERPADVLRHLPNLITILRIVLVVPMCALIAGQRWGLALVVAAAAGISDALDGFLARRFGWRSWLGGMLDPLADKILLMAAFLWLARGGVVAVWLAALVIGRDIVILAGAIAMHLLRGRFDAEPSALSKLTTVVQIVYVLATLVHLWRTGLDTFGLIRGLAFATAVLTVASGAHYIATRGRRILSSPSGAQHP